MKLSYPVPYILDIDLSDDASRLSDGLVTVVLWAIAIERSISLDVWSRWGQGFMAADWQILISLGLAGLFSYRLGWQNRLVQCRFNRRSRVLFLRRSRLLGWSTITPIPWASLSDLRLVVDPKDADYWISQLVLIENSKLTTLQLGDRSREGQVRLHQINEVRRFLGWTTLAYAA